jgi:hypothetical protein
VGVNRKTGSGGDNLVDISSLKEKEVVSEKKERWSNGWREHGISESLQEAVERGRFRDLVCVGMHMGVGESIYENKALRRWEEM